MLFLALCSAVIGKSRVSSVEGLTPEKKILVTNEYLWS